MLKQLTLSNFRLFDDEVTIRFRPITVLIGKNNTGKSSIIKFLLMLQQSFTLDRTGFIAPRGERVNLGKFRDLKNSNSKKQDLKFSLKIKEVSEDKREQGGALSFQNELMKNKDSHQHGITRVGGVNYINESSNDKQEIIDLLIKGDELHRKKLTYRVDAIVSYHGDNSFHGKQQSIIRIIDGKDELLRTADITSKSRFLYFEDEQQRDLANIQSITITSHKLYDENTCVATLVRRLKNMRHISPVRKELPRSFDFGAQRPDYYVGSKGEYTLPLLRKDSISLGMRGFKFNPHHIESILGIDTFEFKENGELAQCIAHNKNTGGTANIADFGFGVSQILPILVQGEFMTPHTSLIVEQPEAQVHPTAQLALGQYYADLWNRNKVCSIIETHSGSILLRLRRLIANNTLTPEDVSVVYLDTEDGKATVKNLTIEKDGTMEDGLPMEFFHADIWEALELGAGK